MVAATGAGGQGRKVSASLPRSEAELLEAFGTYQRAILGFVDSTVQNHRNYLTNYFVWWYGAHSPEQSPTGARPRDVTDFLLAESERGIGPRTRKSELGAVRALYSWLVLTEVRPSCRPRRCCSPTRTGW